MLEADIKSMTIELKGNLDLIGVAACWGAQDTRCEFGPQVIKKGILLSTLRAMGYQATWQDCLTLAPSSEPIDYYNVISTYCRNLSELSANAVKNHYFFAVYGGDHSCAIGTWSGVSLALGETPFGLMWIDAHLDSHTPDSSHSGAIHGMPLAILLGLGDERLTSIGGQQAKLKPEYVCVVGARSYEAEEQALLTSLGVHIFYEKEIETKGLEQVLIEAKNLVSRAPGGYGLSIDLDAIDPKDAPGVGSPELGGLSGALLCQCLQQHFKGDNDLLGLEIVELNPALDEAEKTSNLASELMLSLC
ncbi:Arginase [hydrothermal vent metagenome]|uniref:Arginase n=1 Tax=hydrothermal vent metagenome TaxID=652676 RepID=A0A3B0ZBC0_9ZZZZ